VREAKDWDEDYLDKLPVGEFDWLEVKGRRAVDLTLTRVRERDVRHNLSKAVCALANSGGGVIVLGLSNPENEWQVDDGGIDLRMKRPNTREWLEDIIPTLVDLPLTSLNVYAMRRASADSQIQAGRGVFVLDIADSEQAPHQAIDNKYYARVGGKSRPIGHRLVADILGRRRYPKIELEFEIVSSIYIARDPFPLHVDTKPPQRKRRVDLILRGRNVGRVYARYVSGFIRLPVSLLPYPEFQLEDADLEDIDGAQYILRVVDNTRRDVVKGGLFGASEYGPSWFDPILPNLAHTWKWELPADFHMEAVTDERILWEVYADNAPKNSGSILVREIGFSSKK